MARHGSLAESVSDREAEDRRAANDNFVTGAGNLQWVTPLITDMNHAEVETQAAPLSLLGKQIYEAEGFILKSSAKFYSVYVIADIYGLFSKIGVASIPTKRLAQLQTGNPSRLFIHRLFWIYCGHKKPADVAMQIESQAHNAASKTYYRAIGEWFKCSPSEAFDVVQSQVDSFLNAGCVSRYSVMTPPFDLWRA